MIKHGHNRRDWRSPTYNSWAKMIARCYNPSCDEYKFYGAKGRTVCKRWRKFQNFLEDMGERPPGTTIDRHPSSAKVYRKSNCRWATKKQQSVNKVAEKFAGRTSKFKGVCLQKKTKRSPWLATINENKKQTHIGYFKTEEAAAKAYDKAAFKLWGADAFLNFPDN